MVAAIESSRRLRMLSGISPARPPGDHQFALQAASSSQIADASEAVSQHRYRVGWLLSSAAAVAADSTGWLSWLVGRSCSQLVVNPRSHRVYCVTQLQR